MSKGKRHRKIRSANKLLRKQRGALEAMHGVTIATIIACDASTIAVINASKFAKHDQKEKAKEVMLVAVEDLKIFNDNKPLREITVANSKEILAEIRKELLWV